MTAAWTMGWFVYFKRSAVCRVYTGGTQDGAKNKKTLLRFVKEMKQPDCRLVQAPKKATVIKTITLYKNVKQKSISGHITC